MRSGFRSVTPRLVVPDVRAQVEFMRAVFGAEGECAEDGDAAYGRALAAGAVSVEPRSTCRMATVVPWSAIRSTTCGRWLTCSAESRVVRAGSRRDCEVGASPRAR